MDKKEIKNEVLSITPEVVKKALLKEPANERFINQIVVPMHPDLIDKFVDWIYQAVDPESFRRSNPFYKYRLYKQFLRSLPPEDLQYSIPYK